MRLTLMRKGARQEAELTSREDAAKDVDVPPGDATVSKGNAKGAWLSLRPLHYFSVSNSTVIYAEGISWSHDLSISLRMGFSLKQTSICACHPITVSQLEMRLWFLPAPIP